MQSDIVELLKSIIAQTEPPTAENLEMPMSEDPTAEDSLLVYYPGEDGALGPFTLGETWTLTFMRGFKQYAWLLGKDNDAVGLVQSAVNYQKNEATGFFFAQPERTH